MRKAYWNHKLPQNQHRSDEEMRQHLLAHRNITEGGCWEWTLAISKSGYGKIKWRPLGDLRVHRVAAYLWLGIPIEGSHLLCHRCDNPPCFNPDHLFKGTSRENQIDSVKKNRHWLASKTMCKHGHPFTKENTYCAKNGMRHCRTCHRKRVLASYYLRKGVET